MNTRNNRASAIGIGLAFVSIFPSPGGADSAAERQQMAYCYAGIAAGAPPVDETTVWTDVDATGGNWLDVSGVSNVWTDVTALSTDWTDET